MGKVDVSLDRFSRVLGPRLTAIVSSGTVEKPNAMVAEWISPVSFSPPLVCVSVSSQRFSQEVIGERGEFVLNFFGKELLDKVLFLGHHSGRDTDKFAETGLTPVKGGFVSAPIVSECVSHVECRVEQKFLVGDHVLFVGRVLGISADEGRLDEIAVNPRGLVYWRASGSTEDTWTVEKL